MPYVQRSHISSGAWVYIVLLFAPWTGCTSPILRGLTNGELVAADIWSDEPQILAAGLGFDGIIGLETLDEDTVRAAGGSWYGSLTCGNGEEPGAGMRTTAAPIDGLEHVYDGPAERADGLPIEFSWPVATESMQHTDFEFTLSDGSTMIPRSAGMYPNWELNERSTVVVFDDLGDRLPASDPAARFPVRLEIIDDGTPLTLIGPEGEAFNAVGLTWTTETSGYDQGPVLVAAKLNRIDPEPLGEGGVIRLQGSAPYPNDEVALYGSEGDFRLRVLTSGGFSPDGVTGLRPDRYADFFRVHAAGPDGEDVVLTGAGVDYAVAGGTLRVIGLSDLGQAADAERILYDDCYVEDRDNQIDIILAGSDEAARSVTAVEIPSLDGGYEAFYNPGGPGPEPFPEVTYTAPGPPDLQPVVIALDDPMRVDRAPAN